MAQQHVSPEDHKHVHGPNCGHPAVRHEHVDYLQNGRLQHVNGDQVEEHRMSAAAIRSDAPPATAAGSMSAGDQHGENCGRPAVPHGDHVDYLVGGHLHHFHGDHCDDHGAIVIS